MAGVFDTATKIGRRVPDPGTDDTLAAAGALTWMTITTPMALAGCTGIDAKLVHGDRWQTIQGNMTEMIVLNEMTTIMGNQQHTVLLNRTTTIIGNDMLTIVGTFTELIVGTSMYMQVGAELKTNVAPTIHNFISPLTENHCSPRVINEPTNTMELFGVKFQVSATSNTIVGVQCQIVGLSLQVIGVSTAIIPVESQIKGLTILLCLLTSTLGAAKLDAIAIDLNPGIEANGDSPFA